jgi:hypothetical protein
VHKKKKAIQSESKKNSTTGINQFNDISEIQEFNVTDEESLINSSILKNIEDHESIQQEEMYAESTRKIKFSNGKKSSQSKTKKVKKGGKKMKKMKFISSAKKSGKKGKKPQTDLKDTDKKSIKKRKVIFHISKGSNIEIPDVVDSQGTDHKEGQIKKVDIFELRNKDDSENEIINMEDISPNKNRFQGMKKLDKIEMIGSDKLSELLSSKKKHRYKPVQDSMDGVIDENVGQHINFTQEEANLQFNAYNSQNDSLRDHSREGYEHDIDNLEEDRQSRLKVDDHGEAEEESIRKYESLPSIQQDSIADDETYKNQKLDYRHNRGSSINEDNFVMQSMTYQQEQLERNDLIESEDENQTVIN